ncbi:MAG TPA: hypoxanthine phosphoribosyltransferase [Bacteroidetes bacterium]|nr:hypoxanthine phosphoribosyltransferase [Bacteroidota bacterium]HCN36185.1 hypoxanthine phosphoribosyltransferase [Bacteroidota bacterium]
MKLKRYISSTAIQNRVAQIGSKINKDFKNKNLVVICVLNGAFMFCSDLIKHISLELEIDFIKLSSYKNSKKSSGKISILQELNCDISRKDILIVEDIVDTGLTIKFLRNLLKKKNPDSIKVATLLHKTDVSNIDFKIDYTGFEIENKFVVGYGLDYAQKYRNLKGIYLMS